MDTFRFKRFEVYKDAKKFRQIVRSLLKKFPSDERYALKEQINRSCLSILLNIAEGSAKSSDREFARFLETSISSTNEVVAGFDLACDDEVITEQDLQGIEDAASGIAKQLGGFRKMLLRTPRHRSIVKSHQSIVRGFAA